MDAWKGQSVNQKLLSARRIYTVSQKTAPFYFCNNFVRPNYILIVFSIRVLQ